MFSVACFFFLYEGTSGLIAKLLPGWESALNHHTAFVHFPIALWLVALLFAVIALWRRNASVHRAAVWLLWLGTIAATFAVITGLRAASSVPSGVGNLLQTHEKLMLINYVLAVGLSLWAWFAGSARKKAVLLGGLLILSGLTVLGTDRGAEMVGRYGFGVNGAIRREPAPRPAEPAISVANLK
ncbi:MAG TPA: DUF2231 domain-containing protein, partial [Terriglobia bacterium]|nr:DUF2231 domain-containing protein [Terriglobia bacterium]